MNISTRLYQRIDTNGYWIESVDVPPSISTLPDGSFEIEYVTTPDLIDADVPPSPDYRWDGHDWAEPEIIIPEYPGFTIVRQIDDAGFYIGDVVVEPVLIDNVWAFPGLDAPDYISGDVPGGFYKPRYVNGRWCEGATKQEIKTAQPPNWVQFIADFTASDLDEMIAQPDNIANVMRLNRAFGMYPNLDGQAICDAWNQCLDGLETSPNKDQQKALIKITTDNNLPVTVDAKSRMVMNG